MDSVDNSGANDTSNGGDDEEASKCNAQPKVSVVEPGQSDDASRSSKKPAVDGSSGAGDTSNGSDEEASKCNAQPKAPIVEPGQSDDASGSSKKPAVDGSSGAGDTSNNDDEDYYSEDIEKSNKLLEELGMNSADKDTVKRNPSLIQLTGIESYNAEPPLSLVMEFGFITPVPLHYVRNHRDVPNIPPERWTLQIKGLVNKPVELTMSQLRNNFTSRVFPVTLVCSGNRRMEQNMVKGTMGFDWGAAAVSTSLWRGAPLHEILKWCGIKSEKEGALHVCFEGEDLGDKGGYGTSITREIAMDPARDIILAYMQNGEALTPDHGSPVRLIIPGFIGGRMVKWLKQITVTEQESQNKYHFKDNRVLPSHVETKQMATIQGWWKEPQYIINELNINSVITKPGHKEKLPIKTGRYTLKGYAYSGGGKKVTRVEVTMDGGATWQVCSLYHREKPNKFGKYWCWCFWSLEVKVLHLHEANEIAVRAWDETHNTQPEKLIWNLLGMMNNCWFRVKKGFYETSRGEMEVVFEHPAQPGHEPSGWMMKEYWRPENEDPTPEKMFSASDVQKHNSADSAWIIVQGLVYDVTHYLNEHPPGGDKILEKAGTDCTQAFEDSHRESGNARKKIKAFRIGKLVTTVSCTLHEKIHLSDDVRKFKFTLPFDRKLGVPAGKHIRIRATVGGIPCERFYTPISDVDAVGYFELVVKVYPEGKMSTYLDKVEIGSPIQIEFPLGHIEYTGKGNFLVNGKHRFAKKLAMIAGGVGITPIYQVMQAIMKDVDGDETEMFLVYANHAGAYVPMKEELDLWAGKHRDRVHVKYVEGRVTKEILRENIPKPTAATLALSCGPGQMMEKVRTYLEDMNYEVEVNLLVF